jgi:hypothetical protein
MRIQHILKWTAMLIALFGVTLFLACDCNTPSEDEVGEFIAEWYLSTDESVEPRLTHLVDIAAALSEYGLVVEALEEAKFRLGFYDTDEGPAFLDWIAEADANEAGYLRNVAPIHPGAEGVTLFTHAGLEDDSLVVEIADSKLWMEELTGNSVHSFAYPTHVHDRRIMEVVQDANYLLARNGVVSVEPWGSHLLGLPDDVAWTQGWERTSPFELPLSFLASEIQALDPGEIEAWLAEPDHLPLWKSQHRWIQLYTRTDNQEQTSLEIIDANRLGILLDALQADGDVWVAPLGEIALWALANGQSPDSEDALLWRADAPGAQPWGEDGKACAFSFSTDDGFRSNLTHYMPEFLGRGLSYTAFCSPEKIQIGDTGYDLLLDSDGVRELAAEGIEIACNGMNRRYLLSPEAFLLVDDTDEGYQIEILVEDGYKLLRLWRDW